MIYNSLSPIIFPDGYNGRWDQPPKTIAYKDRWVCLTYYYSDVWMWVVYLDDDGVFQVGVNVEPCGPPDISAGFDLVYDEVNDRVVVFYAFYNGSSTNYTRCRVCEINDDHSITMGPESGNLQSGQGRALAAAYMPNTGSIALVQGVYGSYLEYNTYVRSITVDPATNTVSSYGGVYLGHSGNRTDIEAVYDPVQGVVLMMYGKDYLGNGYAKAWQTVQVTASSITLGSVHVIVNAKIPADNNGFFIELIYDPSTECFLFHSRSNAPIAEKGLSTVIKISGTSITFGETTQSDLLTTDYPSGIFTAYNSITNGLHICVSPYGSDKGYYISGKIIGMQLVLDDELTQFYDSYKTGVRFRGAWSEYHKVLFVNMELSYYHYHYYYGFGIELSDFWTLFSDQREKLEL